MSQPFPVLLQLLLVVGQMTFGANDVSQFDPEAKKFHCCNTAKMDLWDPKCPIDKTIQCDQGQSCQFELRMFHYPAAPSNHTFNFASCNAQPPSRLNCSPRVSAKYPEVSYDCTCGRDDNFFHNCNPLGLLRQVKMKFCPLPLGGQPQKSDPKCLSPTDHYCRYEVTQIPGEDWGDPDLTQFKLTGTFCNGSQYPTDAEKRKWPTSCELAQTDMFKCKCVGANCIKPKLTAIVEDLMKKNVSQFDSEIKKFSCCSSYAANLWDPKCPEHKLVTCDQGKSCQLEFEVNHNPHGRDEPADNTVIFDTCNTQPPSELNCSLQTPAYPLSYPDVGYDCTCGRDDNFFHNCNPLAFLHQLKFKFCPRPDNQTSSPECLPSTDHCHYEVTRSLTGGLQFQLTKGFCIHNKGELADLKETEVTTSCEKTQLDHYKCECLGVNCIKQNLMKVIEKLITTTTTSTAPTTTTTTSTTPTTTTTTSTTPTTTSTTLTTTSTMPTTTTTMPTTTTTMPTTTSTTSTTTITTPTTTTTTSTTPTTTTTTSTTPTTTTTTSTTPTTTISASTTPAKIISASAESSTVIHPQTSLTSTSVDTTTSSTTTPSTTSTPPKCRKVDGTPSSTPISTSKMTTSTADLPISHGCEAKLPERLIVQLITSLLAIVSLLLIFSLSAIISMPN